MAPIVYIIVGTILLAVGGVAVTYGWDLKSSAENARLLQQRWDDARNLQRAAMLRTLNATIADNFVILAAEQFTNVEESGLKNTRFYPRSLLAAFKAALPVGLFVPPEDTKLFAAMNTAVRTIEGWNNFLQLANNQLASPISLKGQLENVNRGVKTGQSKQHVLQAMTEVNEAMSQYSYEDGRLR